jgi:RHS repeat-associated protein
MLLRQVQYPDSSGGSDVVLYEYDRQSHPTKFTDQLGTVHQYDTDKLGRRTQDRVTTLGSGVDPAVKRIATTYDVRGGVDKVTSYDSATVGSGAVVNDLQRGYNTFQQLTIEYQAHAAAVNTATTAKCQYAYANGSANTVRPTSLTYPNGWALTYDYGTGGGMNDSAGRIGSLIDGDGTTHLADYSYLGGLPPLSKGGPGGVVVETDLTQPDLLATLVTTAGGDDPDTGDIYRGFDRFGRIKDLQWRDYGAGSDAARILHSYDRAGNRLYREDPVATANGKKFDELYRYDASYRLADMQRGTLNAGKTAITAGTLQFEQCWTLDPTGNWRGFREDTTGDATWDLIQSRTANPVNEITGITNTTGPGWAQPAYNAVGNMTTIPQPAAPASSYTATYDAWNRLVKLVDGANTVQENQYDGLRRRTIRKSYTAGVLSETRHYYYTANWQIIEERLGTTPDSATANRRFVWGLRYIDDLILRDRDTTGGGTLNERLYGIQDPNWNMIALANTTGDVQERYAYSAYGMPSILTPAFAPRASSLFAWETLYAGYRWDSATGLFQVRERLYAALLGTWLSRDPLAISSGPSLYQYVDCRPTLALDPLGLESLEKGLLDEIESTGQVSLSFDSAWGQYCKKFPSGAKDNLRKNVWPKGCVGVTSCMIGQVDRMSTETGWFRDCYTTLAKALDAKRRTNCSKTGKKNLCGKPSQARIVAYTWQESPENKKRRSSCSGCGFVYWNGAVPERPGAPGGDVFDFGYFDDDIRCFWHANYSEKTQGSAVLISKPDKFHPQDSSRSAVYCVVCDTSDILEEYE